MTEQRTASGLDTLPAEAGELTEGELDAAAGGEGVSPNVQSVFDNLNQNVAVKFDLPNYVQHNLPLAEPRMYPYYQGLQTPGPDPNP